MISDIHLADGVCASYDGYYVWLDLRAQDHTTRIALEPFVIEALWRYVEAIQREAQKENP